MDTTLSSNGFSVDQQALDALEWLEATHPTVAASVLADFPELADVRLDGAWFDTEAMGVDPEWGSWLIDSLESTGLVEWFEGEPWATSGLRNPDA